MAKDCQAGLTACVPLRNFFACWQRETIDSTSKPNTVSMRCSNQKTVKVNVPQVPFGNLPCNVLVLLLAGKRMEHHLFPRMI